MVATRPAYPPELRQEAMRLLRSSGSRFRCSLVSSGSLRSRCVTGRGRGRSTWASGKARRATPAARARTREMQAGRRGRGSAARAPLGGGRPLACPPAAACRGHGREPSDGPVRPAAVALVRLARRPLAQRASLTGRALRSEGSHRRLTCGCFATPMNVSGPHVCPNCGERVSVLATGCAPCGAPLDPRRAQGASSLRQTLRGRWLARPRLVPCLAARRSSR